MWFTVRPVLCAEPEEFADTLPLWLADAVWAVLKGGDTRPAADVEAALEQWSGEALVADAAALAVNVVDFGLVELEPLYRALVRAAREAWRRERAPWPLAQSLHDRARAAWADEHFEVAADLLTAAIGICDGILSAGGMVPPERAVTRLLGELLGMLVKVLADSTPERPDHARQRRIADAARRRVELLGAPGAADEPVELAVAHRVAAEWVALIDGAAAALEHSERAVYLYEEALHHQGVKVASQIDIAWQQHIDLLDRDRQPELACEWRRHRCATVRALAASGPAAHRELAILLRVCRRRELWAEAVAVSARIVDLAAAGAAADRSGLGTLARELHDYGRCLYFADRRPEALDAWWRAVRAEQLAAQDRPNEAEAVNAAHRTVVTIAAELGDRSAAVDFGAAAVAVALRFAETDPHTHLAAAVDELRTHAARLLAAGRFAEASDTAEGAVTRCRELLADDAARYRPNSSLALTCATRMHLRSGRIADAERRSQQALALIEELAQEQPDQYRAPLANALHNRALVFIRRADHASAQRLTDQSIALYENSGDTSLDGLANALCTRSICCSARYEFSAAVIAATRAKEIYAQLAGRDRARYLSDLVYALNRLASVHEDSGADEAVVPLATEALTLCESLPDGPVRDKRRASALHQLVRNLHRRGRFAEALQYSTPLVDLRERLAAAGPMSEEIELAIVLGNHSSCLSGTGASAEALEYARRGAELIRRQVDTDPLRYRGWLAEALDKYAVDLHATRAFQQAVTVSAEAVTHFDALLAEDVERYARAAARCFDNHAMRLGAIGRTDEAVASGVRALALLEPLAARNSPLFGPDLCHTLVNQAVRMNTLERYPETLGYAERAIALLDDLADRDRQRFALETARALLPYSYALSRCGRYGEAVAAQKRAVRAVEAECTGDRQANRLQLAYSLDGLVARLTEADRRAPARRSSRAAIACWEDLTDKHGPTHRPGLAGALDTYVELCCDDKDWAEAGEYARQAVACYAILSAEDSRYRPDWALAGEYQAWALSEDGKRDQAGVALDRALALRRQEAERSPARGRVALAYSESWAARIRLDLREPDAAAAHWERGRLLYEELVDSGRDDLIPALLAAHHRYALRLGTVGDLISATRTITAALPRALQLVAADRARHRPRLAALLRDHVGILADLGQRRQALSVAHAALGWELEIAGAAEAGDRRWHIADGYDQLADSFAETGRLTDALQASDRAVPLWEELAAETHRPSFDLAWSLWRRARWLGAAAGSDAEVLALSGRAVVLFERVCAEQRDRREHLAGALVDHAWHLARAGDPGRALRVSGRARALWEVLAAREPSRYRAELVGCLRRHSIHLYTSGRSDAALACARRSVWIAEQAMELAPDRLAPELAAACETLTDLLCDRASGAALVSARRAVTLYERLADAEPELFESQWARARSRAVRLATRTTGEAGPC